MNIRYQVFVILTNVEYLPLGSDAKTSPGWKKVFTWNLRIVEGKIDLILMSAGSY